MSIAVFACGNQQKEGNHHLGFSFSPAIDPQSQGASVAAIPQTYRSHAAQLSA